MELLVRYGDVLGAERLIDTDNVCGANIFNPQQRKLAGGNLDDVFAQISLDSPGGFEIPRVRAHSCQLIGPMDTLEWQVQGVPEETRDAILDSESYSARHGIHLMNTCTPYQVGNVPTRGEHCAWMESSAVIYVNSVLGAMTNVEGRESAAAAMLTGKIPYWGYHRPENRHATVHVEVTVDVRYGPAEREAAYARLNTTAADTAVDLVMIGCPHASLDQIRDVCDLLGNRKVAPGTELWLFTPRGIRLLAERSGYGDRLRAAGAVLMSDTCPAIGRFVPDGTRVIVTDSAKQAHYLPAIMGVQGWFGDTRECVDAAVTGRWEGNL
jgi:predicted aconitase